MCEQVRPHVRIATFMHGQIHDHRHYHTDTLKEKITPSRAGGVGGGEEGTPPLPLPFPTFWVFWHAVMVCWNTGLTQSSHMQAETLHNTCYLNNRTWILMQAQSQYSSELCHKADFECSAARTHKYLTVVDFAYLDCFAGNFEFYQKSIFSCEKVPIRFLVRKEGVGWLTLFSYFSSCTAYPPCSDIFKSSKQSSKPKLVGLFLLKIGKRSLRALASSIPSSLWKYHCRWDRLYFTFVCLFVCKTSTTLTTPVLFCLGEPPHR